MTKMAAIPIYGKNPLKIFFSGTGRPISTKLGMYEGHSGINDTEFISRKVLLESVCFVMSYEDTYITYVCLEFGAFIMASFDAMII